MDDLGVPLWLMKPPFGSLFRFGSLCRMLCQHFPMKFATFVIFVSIILRSRHFAFVLDLILTLPRFVLTRMLTSSMANTKHIGGLVIKTQYGFPLRCIDYTNSHGWMITWQFLDGRGSNVHIPHRSNMTKTIHLSIGFKGTQMCRKHVFTSKYTLC